MTQGRLGERLLRESFLRSAGNDPWVITTPSPLDEHSLLVAAGEKNHPLVRAEFPKDAVDLGLYTMCVDTGQLELLYNDPQAACFEARPLHPRRVPPVLDESDASRSSQFTGWLFAQSAFITRQPHVPRAVPDGPDQFRYCAKIWFKGHTPDEREERQRTVHSINWFGRP